MTDIVTSPPLRDLVIELRRLPVQTAVAGRLLTLVEDPGTSATDLAVVLESDPALASRVLHLANTPVYGLTRRIGSVSHAVVVVGLDTLRALAAAAACGLLTETDQYVPDGFWDHAVTTAALASVISRHAALPLATDVAGAALLHDVGTALLHRVLGATYADLQREAGTDGAALAAAEREHLGIDHGEAGAIALDSLRLPPAIVQAVRAHHEVPTTPVHAVVSASNDLADWLTLNAGTPLPTELRASLEALVPRTGGVDALLTEVVDATHRGESRELPEG